MRNWSAMALLACGLLAWTPVLAQDLGEDDSEEKPRFHLEDEEGELGAEPEAEPEPEPVPTVTRRFNLGRPEGAIGLALLKEHGFGLAARFLAGPIGLEASVGYQPWLVVIGGDCSVFEGYMKLHGDGMLLIRLKNFANDRMRLLLKLGGGWQEDFGYEGKAGVGFDLYLAQHFLFEFGLGLTVVPGAYDFVGDVADEKCGSATVPDADRIQATIQPYIGTTAYLRF